MPLTVRNLPKLQATDGDLFQTISDLKTGVELALEQTNADGTGTTPSPPPISALNVSGQDGFFHASISDTTLFRGLEYFFEWSPNASFSPSYQIANGPSRDWRGGLGNITTYWRANSAYSTSGPSPYVYFGSQTAPTPVTGGGSATGPALLPPGGSGTGGGGYGTQAYTPVNGKKPVRK